MGVGKINVATLMIIVNQFCCLSGLIHLPRALQRQDSEIVALSEGSSLSLPPIDFEQDVWEEGIEPIEPDLTKRDGEKFEKIEPMELEMKLPLRLLEVLERGASRNTALQVTILTLLLVVIVVLLVLRTFPSKSREKFDDRPLPKPWTLGPLKTWNHGPWRPSWNVTTKNCDLDESLQEKHWPEDNSNSELNSITSTLEEKNQLQINPLCVDSALLV